MFRKACLVVAFGLFVFAGPNYGQSATISSARQATTDRSIRPFKAYVSQTAIEDLRRRIAATRWPDKETVKPLQTSSKTRQPGTQKPKRKRPNKSLVRKTIAD